MPWNNEQLRCLIALEQLPGMGSKRLNKLLEKTPNPCNFFDKNHQCLLFKMRESKKINKKSNKKENKTQNEANNGVKHVNYQANVDWSLIDKCLNWALNPNCHILTFWDKEYPILLKEISDAPAVLYVKGDISKLHQIQIAIVGSRNPSSIGCDIAMQFAEHFSSLGITVTSGLAIGIDTASHVGAIKQKGGTIAVLGNGLDYIYPPTNEALSQKIELNGALVSEFPIGVKPWPTHFPRRNRIISGLSLGTLVVEAALKSGSLITARFALEQDREVFAIPGSIHSSKTKGCHDLIRQGAKLVDTIEDVLEEFDSMVNLRSIQQANNKINSIISSQSLTVKYRRLLNHLGFEPSSMDSIVKRSQLTAREVSIMLLELELWGYISSVPGGYMRLVTSI